MRCQIKVDAESYKVSKVSFNLNDEKGRNIGMHITRFSGVATEDERGWGYDVAPGTVLAVRAMAARDGVSFGASHGTKYFATEAERDAYIAKRVRETKKRYEKQFA